MTKVDLPYINVQRGRDGRVRHWYFRRHGRRWALPGEPMSSPFMEEYQRLLTEMDKPAASPPPDRRSYASGSFGLLVNEYLASAEYREKKPSTKAEYRRVLEVLQELHGGKPVNQLKRRHIRRMRDERADTPGAANTIVRMLKIVLNFAVEEEWIESNPASKMRLLKTGEWRAWTDEECQKYKPDTARFANEF